ARQHQRTGFQAVQWIPIGTACISLAFGGLFRREERLVLQPRGAFERNGGSGAPGAVKVRMYARGALRRLPGDAQRRRKSQNPEETCCVPMAAGMYIHTSLCRIMPR